MHGREGWEIGARKAFARFRDPETLANFWRFHPSSREWDVANPLPTDRLFPISFFCDDRARRERERVECREETFRLTGATGVFPPVPDKTMAPYWTGTEVARW